MYCTLQEAYNIPAFDSSSGKKKKNCMVSLVNPSKSSSQTAQQVAISQEDLGAFNDFIRNRDYAAAKAEYTKEDFVGSSDISGSGGKLYNDRYSKESNRDQKGGVFDTSTPYSTQGINYKYYCDNYKICPKSQINSSEGFVATKENVPTPGSTNGAIAPGQCSSLQAPIYEIPISDAAKEAYSEAMNVSLSQEYKNNLPVVPEARVYDMKNVTGYYDEDLEQYLKTKNDAGSNKTPLNDAVSKYSSQQLGIPVTPNSNEQIQRPYSNSRENTDGSGQPQVIIKEVIQKSNNLSKLDYIIDIVLFILIGILIILLCDQIFKVAMVYGMQETMRLLHPYLTSSE